MGNKGGAGASKSITQSLDNKRSCNKMLWTCLTMGKRPPSLTLLSAHVKPLYLCNVMLRMMSLMVAMQLRVLCPEINGESWGGERYSLLSLVMMLLFLTVVVDVVVVVVLKKVQILKDGGGTDRQTCGYCLKMAQLGQITLSV